MKVRAASARRGWPARKRSQPVPESRRRWASLRWSALLLWPGRSLPEHFGLPAKRRAVKDEWAAGGETDVWVRVAIRAMVGGLDGRGGGPRDSQPDTLGWVSGPT